MPCCIKHASQGPSGTLVPRFDMCKSTISLELYIHQMWQGHTFSPRNKATKRAVGVEAEEGVNKTCKREVGNTGGLHKIIGLGTICQLWCYII